MLALVLAVLGIVGTALAYWVGQAGERKLRRQLAQKRELEDELERAMASRDPQRIAELRRRVRLLADETGTRVL